MKRLALLLAALIPASVAVAATAPPALASNCTVGHYDAGYRRNSIVADGASARVRVSYTAAYSKVQFVSTLRGWITVDNEFPLSGYAGNYWVQAGLENDGGRQYGLIRYIEYQDPAGYYFVDKGAALAGSSYAAQVTKVSAGVWTASIGGYALGYNINVSGMTGIQMMGDSFMGADETCNEMDFEFTASYPWTTSQMTRWQTSPYYVESTGSTSWISYGQ